VLTGLHRDSVERVNGDRGAVEQRPLLVGDGIGQRVDVRRGNGAAFREASRARDADVLELLAEREATGLAEGTGPAPDHRHDGHAVSAPDLLDAGAHRGHLTGELVALRRAWVGDGVELPAGAVLVQVASADAGRQDSHDHLAGLGRRIRALLDADVARAVEDSREHGTHLTGRWGSSQRARSGSTLA
jgi:hypothetical protein